MIAIAIISLFSIPSWSATKAKSYENFNLPTPATGAPAGETSIPEDARATFLNDRVKIGKNVKVKEPSVNAQQYVFAKEAFLAEKRDEAIKLLRQELDSNFKQNRDNILLRLGQLYSEKYMELSFHENELYTSRLDDYEKLRKTDKNAKPPKLDNSRSQSYLKDSLGLFTQLEKEFPRHPKIDEIIFFIGFVEMEFGNTVKGTKYLERVVREYPRSRKYEEAVVYLGDQLFDKVKFRDALVKYKILTQRKNSSLYDYARYKIAWCELNTGEQNKALRDMKSVIADLAGQQEVSKFNLREQALKDLVVFYGEAGNVDEAITYFTEVQGKDKAFANLKLIAEILKSKARDDVAMRAYERLIEEYPDSLETPRMYVGLHDSMARLGKTDVGVRTLVKAMEQYGTKSGWPAKFPAEKQAEAKAASDSLAEEAERAALFYHGSAQKSSNKGSSNHAVALYKALLTEYPQYKDRKKIAYYLAELLYSQGSWLAASENYMIAARILPKDKIADESTYNALLALDRLTAKNDKLERYSKEDQKKVELTPEEIPSNELKFIEVAQFYVKEYPQGSRVVDVKFRIAAIYYHYHHFDESQEAFKEIAMKYPRHRSATTAANIVLDIYNIKKDYVALDAMANQFAKTDGLGDAAFRAEMASISGEIGFKKLEKLEADNKWKEAGDSYYAFYQKNPTGPLAEKSLYNAYVSYEKAGDSIKTAEVSALFVAKFPKSEYGKRFMLALAKNAEKIYDFEAAQKYYSEFHQKYPTDKDATKALYNAAVFAELLEKNSVALALYDQYLKLKTTTEEEKHSIYLSEAKIHRLDGHWDKVNQIYRRMASQSKSMGQKIQWLGELARQYDKGNRLADRNSVMNEIRVMYDGNKGVKISGPAVAYVAEAKFKAIEKQRDNYDKIELKFPPENLVYLLHRKQKLLAKLSASYDEVVSVGVPEWGVAALYEKGDAFQNIINGFKGVQVPNKYKPEEREVLQNQLKALEAKLISPLEKKADEYFGSCASKASEFYVANEFATKCRERVAKTSKSVEPSGTFPQPTYWTTRWTGEGVAKK